MGAIQASALHAYFNCWMVNISHLCLSLLLCPLTIPNITDFSNKFAKFDMAKVKIHIWDMLSYCHNGEVVLQGSSPLPSLSLPTDLGLGPAYGCWLLKGPPTPLKGKCVLWRRKKKDKSFKMKGVNIASTVYISFRFPKFSISQW